MLNRNYYKAYSFLLFVFICAAAAAQTKQDSLHALYDTRNVNPSFVTKSPAVFQLASIPQYGYAKTAYSHQHGSYKRPMQEASSHNLKIESGGQRNVNGWLYRGMVNYEKSRDKKLPYSNMHDAYNNNPFIWADTISGDWKRDDLNTTAGITSPLIKRRLHVGMDIFYKAGSGARMNDPKPYYRLKNIQFNPGFLFKINENNKIGIAGNGTFINEENELGFYSNANNDAFVYSLRGFGTFSRYPFVKGERKNTSHRYYGNIHYLFDKQDYSFTTSIHLQNRKDKVTEGVAVRNTIGYYSEVQSGAGAAMYKGTAQNGYKLDVNYNHTDGRGDDEFFKATNTYFKANHLKTSFSLWKQNHSKNYLIQWNADPVFISERREDKAQETDFSYTSVFLPFEINFRKYFTQFNSLQIKPGLAYNKVLSHGFNKKNPSRPAIVVDKLFYPWYQYLSSDYGSLSLLVNYEFGNNKHTHSIAFNGSIIKADNKNMKTRSFAGVTYQFTF